MAQGSRRGPRSSSHRAPPLTTSCELSLGSGLSPPPGWPSTPARSEDRSTSEILACDADFGSANPTDPQRLSAACGGHGHRATGRSAGETAALQPRPRTHAGVNRPRRRRLAAQEEPDRLAGANGIPTPVVRQVLQHLHAAAGGRRRRVPLAPRRHRRPVDDRHPHTRAVPGQPERRRRGGVDDHVGDHPGHQQHRRVEEVVQVPALQSRAYDRARQAGRPRVGRQRHQVGEDAPTGRGARG